jgi:hypothetical protein
VPARPLNIGPFDGGGRSVGIDLFFQTMERLTPQLRAGDLAGCEA